MLGEETIDTFMKKESFFTKNGMLKPEAKAKMALGGMTINEYSAKAMETDTRFVNDLNFSSLALCAEVGQIANKIKLRSRDETDYDDLILSKLGNILWLVAKASRDIGSSLGEVAKISVMSRYDGVNQIKL